MLGTFVFLRRNFDEYNQSCALSIKKNENFNSEVDCERYKKHIVVLLLE